MQANDATSGLYSRQHAGVTITCGYLTKASRNASIDAKLCHRTAPGQEDEPDKPLVYPAANDTIEGSVQLKMLQILQEIVAAQNVGHNNAE